MNKEIEFIFDNLKNDYDSGEGDDLGTDFFTPCLKHCIQYDRTTSDFTSNVIFQWGEAILKLVDIDNHPCKIRIIAHHKLHDEDKIILEEFLKNESKLDEYLEKISEGIFDEALKLAKGNAEKETKLKMFAYLIATKRLELKFAFPHHVQNANVFHQKYGIFTFKDNLKIGFLGGPNETIGGYLNNIETIEVFNGKIVSDLKRISSWEQKFFRSWNDEAKGFRTKSISKKTLDRIISYSPVSANKYQELNNNNEKQKSTTIKENYLDIVDQKWSFQEKARKIFIEKKWGLLEMATGTGKTRTALAIATQLINENKINKIIIQMKGTDLIKQWRENINLWTDSKINRSVNILESTADKDELDTFLLNFENPEVDLLLIRQSNLPNLLNKLEKFNLEKTLIVHDEVHDLFAKEISELIINKQENFGYKLGLSATIEEPFDKERQRVLFKEIQGVGSEPIFKYSLIDAIKDGVLVESKLEVLTYKLYKDEKNEIGAAHARCQTRIKEGWLKNEAEAQRNMEVADVRKNARNKIEVFEENIEYLKDKLKRSFIFADETEYGKKILNVLTPYLNVKTHFQDSDTENLENFSKNKIECIINVLKLSQGIDIQNLNTIVLFATPTGRQFIQRIGRVLRKDKNNLNKKAVIIDFFDEDDLKNENENSTDYRRYLELKKITDTKYEPR